MDAIAVAARDLKSRCRALLKRDNPYPVDINLVRAIEQDLQHSVVAIRQYYNASPFAPINRLQPELLGMIFRLIRRPRVAATPAYPEGRRFDSYKPLLAPMLVCQKWHTLITQDSSLWTEVDLNRCSANVVQHLLERSQAASLHVRFAYSCSGPFDLASFLKNNAHRFHEIEVKLNRHADCTSKMLPLLDVSMPCLESLVISLSESRMIPRTVHAMSFTPYPALKALVLSGTLLLPKEHILSLTHLHVGFVGDDSIPSLMNLLRATPALQVLDLRRISMATMNITTSSVTFLALRILRVSDMSSANAVHFLLSHLVAPNLAVADITEVVGWYDSDLGAPRDYIPDSFLRDRAMTRLRVELLPRTVCWSFTAIFENDHFRLTLQHTASLCSSILSTSSMLQRLDNIEDAYFDIRDPSHVGDAVWLASRLQHVKALIIGGTIHNGLHLLQHNEPVLFPALVSLGLDSLQVVSQTADIDAIVSALEGRTKIAGPLPVLRIRDDAGLEEQLKGPGGVKIGKCVDSMELVRLPRVQDSLWTAGRPDTIRVGEHGYWA